MATVSSMKFLFAIFLSCFAAVHASPRILGGKDAPEGKYPYMVSIRIAPNTHICGGSILNKRWILTAAQCTHGHKQNSLKVVAGTNLLEGGQEQVYQSERVIAFRYWNDPPQSGDVGLIRVDKDIEFNDKVQSIKLPKENFHQSGSLAVMSGWGSDGWRGPNQNNLQEITVKIMDKEPCQDAFGGSVEINESHICSLNDVGEGVCNGDAGSPLVVDGVPIGIVSFGLQCGIGYPDVYTRVYTFLDWIADEQAKF